MSIPGAKAADANAGTAAIDGSQGRHFIWNHVKRDEAYFDKLTEVSFAKIILNPLIFHKIANKIYLGVDTNCGAEGIFL
jgi:hypothetical protein